MVLDPVGSMCSCGCGAVVAVLDFASDVEAVASFFRTHDNVKTFKRTPKVERCRTAERRKLWIEQEPHFKSDALALRDEVRAISNAVADPLLKQRLESVAENIEDNYLDRDVP